MKGFFQNRTLTYLITEGKAVPENYLTKAQEILQIIKVAVETGIDLIQIREKKLPAKLVFELITKAVRITKQSNTKILVNDRADIAFAANADGVHLTANSIPAEIIRQSFPNEFIIGVSAHTLATAQAARTSGADFAAFSPIFQSPNKGKPRGLEGLHEVCKTLKPFPIFALGGIDETNFAEILDAGAKGIAAIRLYNDYRKFPEIVKQIQNYQRRND